MGKIVTTFVYPPIPDRRFDWQAHWDGDEPNDNGSMLTGSGRTEAEAIADLIANDPDRAEAEAPAAGSAWVRAATSRVHAEREALMPRTIAEQLDYVINEAISMTLENLDPCPQGLVNEHFDMWQRAPMPLPVRGLELTVSVRELANKIAAMVEADIASREAA